MNFRLWAKAVACVSVVVMSAHITVGDSQDSEPASARPRPPAEVKKSSWLHELYLREASEYDFVLDTERREKLELRREPVMRWTSEGDYNGEVYVWTNHGVAAVVGCIFSGPLREARQVMHEFHSLTKEPLALGGNRGSGWHSQEPGITLEPIPDAPDPAQTRVLRLAQMRDLAKRFTSQVDRQGGMSEMRLLPQPIYRYEVSEGGSVVDGAVFAFVWTSGTDPEVLVVIEARKTDRGVQWQYAAARFTNREARLKYQGREVWKADQATAGIFDGVTSKRYGAFSVKTVQKPADK